MHAGLLMQVSRSQMLDSLLLALRGLPQHLVIPLLRRCRHIRHQAESCHRTSEQDNRYLLGSAAVPCILGTLLYSHIQQYIVERRVQDVS